MFEIKIIKLLLIILGLFGAITGFQILAKDNHQLHNTSKTKDVICHSLLKKQGIYEITCSNEDARNIKAYFESNKMKFHGCLIYLYIINVKFPGNKLPRNWINGTFQIKDLSFKNCFSLQEIEPFAFNSWTFQNMKSLNFDDVKIRILDENSFGGLLNLQHLTIKNSRKLTAELILERVANTLISFKYQQSIENDTINLFSLLLTKTSLLNLNILEYNMNRSDEIIYKDTFNHSLNLKQIILFNHGMEIESGAFDGLTELDYLNITRNNIYIPDGLFDKVIKRIIFINIYAEYWECNCDLLYLANLYRNYPNKFLRKNMQCFSLKHSIKKDITIVIDSCSNTTTKSSTLSTTPSSETSAISTTSSTLKTSSDPTTALTTPVHKRLKKIDCNSNCSNCTDVISTKNVLEIKEADIEFYLLSKDLNGVQIYLEEFIENLDIIWFSNDTITQDRLELFYTEDNPTIQDLGCGLGINCKTVTIDHLQFNMTYTFCLIKRGENEISPFNCRSHYIGNSTSVPNIDDDDKEYLIPCELELLTLILLSFGIILAAVFGALATFCIIRRNPSLLKGSRRVLFIQKSDKRASSSISCNMETRTSNISTISNNRPTAQRRYSDSSIESGRSYVLPSNFYEVIEYKQKIELEKKEKVYFDKFPTNSPPPLPKRCSK